MSGYKGPNNPRTGETFLPLSRGLRRYQRVYSGNGISLFLWILQGADWRPGPDYGILEATLLEMREGLGQDRKTIQTALRELARGYPFPFLSRTGDIAPAFIEIMSKSRRGREALYRIRVVKAKLRLDNFDRFAGNGEKSPDTKALEKEILGGKIEEIQEIVGKTAEALDVKKHLTRIK